jgi:hypothetical protein
VFFKVASPTIAVIAATEKLAVAEKHKSSVPLGPKGSGLFRTAPMDEQIDVASKLIPQVARFSSGKSSCLAIHFQMGHRDSLTRVLHFRVSLDSEIHFARWWSPVGPEVLTIGRRPIAEQTQDMPGQDVR